MKKKIYLIGSGWVTKGFLDTINYDLYDVHVISENENFIYHPFLASSILNYDKLNFNLQKKYPKIIFHKSKVKDFNFHNNEIITDFKKNENYDYLILSHGSIINDFNVKGLKENCYFLKNDHDILKIKKKIKKLPDNSNIAIMGCGLTGSEIIGYLIDSNKYKYKLDNYIDGLIIFDKIKNKKINIYAIDGLPKPLNIFKDDFRNYTMNLWKNSKVNLHFGSFIKSVDEKEIHLHNGTNINYDMGIWCGGIKIHPLSSLINKKLNYNNNFGVPVNKFLKIEKLDNVWAAGDCAYSGFIPNAQVAYQQGTYLGNNFNNKLINNKEFKFQNKGQVCYIGNNEALYQNEHFGFSGIMGYGMLKLIQFYIKYL